MKLHIPRQLDKQLQKEKSLIDHLAIVAGIVGPIATLPQAISVWNGNIAGVSILMWILFLGVSIVLFLYSMLYRLRALFIAEVIWIGMEVIIISGIVINS